MGKDVLGITAMEVMEHLEDPVGFIQANLEQYSCDTLIFTTELNNDKVSNPGLWWYYSLETGQHIRLFQ